MDSFTARILSTSQFTCHIAHIFIYSNLCCLLFDSGEECFLLFRSTLEATRSFKENGRCFSCENDMGVCSGGGKDRGYVEHRVRSHRIGQSRAFENARSDRIELL